MSSASQSASSAYAPTTHQARIVLFNDPIEEELPLHSADASKPEDSSFPDRRHDDRGYRNSAHTLRRPMASIRNILIHCRTLVENFVARNAGLLLIVASQWFFALMNLGVKYLVGLDQPVPTFEVCTNLICSFLSPDYSSCVAGWNTDGTCALFSRSCLVLQTYLVWATKAITCVCCVAWMSVFLYFTFPRLWFDVVLLVIGVGKKLSIQFWDLQGFDIYWH